MAGIGSVKRAADILNLYTQGHASLGPTQAARELRLNKTTVIRLMSTRVATGLLKKTAAGRKYSLGGGIMKLARAFLESADLTTISLPYLEKLRDLTGETISIDVREGDERVCVLIVEGNYPVRLGAKVEGERATLHAGSDSKLLLAYLPDEEVEAILQRTGLPRYTGATITDRHRLKQEIDDIRARGFATSKEERWEYAYCISAPIRDYTRRVVATVSIFGVIMRLTPAKEKEFPELLKETAREISLQIGYWELDDRKQPGIRRQSAK
jgi:DNA-binding IclR family transcriptional regulator